MLSQWADRYPTDFGYTYGYYPELSPAVMQLALANVGVLPPCTDNAFHYCELGFGQGVTLNVLAAGHAAGRFIGTDFNPEHVHFARTLQAASQADVCTYEDSFESFCERPLPEFDFIVAHGIWSWVNPDQWHHLVRFVRERLRPGGVFYLSYNALPGWAKYMPIHELISTVAHHGLPRDIDSGTRLKRALAQAQGVVDQKSGYFEINPQVRERFERLADEDPHYLAHEYLNRHWTPAYFHQVERQLRDAKLTYVCPGNLLGHLDFLELGPGQRAFLNQLESPTLRETARDYLCNRQFRRDLYVKGPVRVSRAEQRDLLMDFAFALRVPAAAISLSVDGLLGTAALDTDLYRAVIARLEENQHRVTPLSELVQDPRLAQHGFDRLYQALFVLAAKGDVAAVKGGDASAPERRCVDDLNAWLLKQATNNLGLPLLVDAVTRGALPANHVEQLYLHGLSRGICSDAALVDHIEAALHRTGRRLEERGAPPGDVETRRALVRDRLRPLLGGRLELLTARGIVSQPQPARPPEP